MKSGMAISMEETVTMPSGEMKSYTVIKMPLRDEKNKIIGIIGNSLDITELKQTQAELEIAKERAEVANKLKSDFIQNMQHDMRTPISGIYGILKDVYENKDRGLFDNSFELMAKAAKELLGLCNDIIDFEDHEYGNHAIKNENLSLEAAVLHVIDLNSAAAKHRGINLALTIDADVPEFIKSDGYRLKKILTNLIGNGIKFTHEGEVKLQIRFLEKQKNYVLIQFEISDTGIGVPENKINVIFEKFTRLTPSSQEIYKGSGLGLSYVKKFVDDLGGSIEVKSQLNIGTQFSITLPLEIPHEGLISRGKALNYQIIGHPSQQAPETKKVKKVKHRTEKLFRASILIIEDQKLALTIAIRKFEEADCNVDFSENVSDSLKKLDEQKYDLVVSDLGLPDGTGFDILNNIKINTQGINHNTPFIALTAHIDEEKRKQCKDTGFLAMYPKPIEMKMVQEILDAYVPSKSDESSQNNISMVDRINPEIFDFIATQEKLRSNEESVFETLELFYNTLIDDRQDLEESYSKDDVKRAREILHRIEGGLCYISLPRLQNALLDLHDAARKTNTLSSLDVMYQKACKEMDAFNEEYHKIKDEKKP